MNLRPHVNTVTYYVGGMQVVFALCYSLGLSTKIYISPVTVLIVVSCFSPLLAYWTGRRFGVQSETLLGNWRAWLVATTMVLLTPPVFIIILASIIVLRQGLPGLSNFVTMTVDFVPPVPIGPLLIPTALFFLVTIVLVRYSFGLGMWHGHARWRRKIGGAAP